MSNIPHPTSSNTISSINNFRTKLISKVTTPKFLIIIALIAGFIALALFVYNKYVAPKLNPDFVPNKEFISKDSKYSGADDATLYYFYVDWCPICKKCSPMFNKLEDFYKKNQIENVDFKILQINGETNESDMTSFEKQYNINIDGYPSIYLVKNDKVIEYDATPSLKTLKEFINTTL
jgi:thiol-disulfide isomerase/thioredoxin|uniref:Thioredoxin domain-containing protein n=1 Tax=viral metagenome TaxID=1070528 RepID=A0A6C0BZ48_9ZZZZ